MREAKVCKTRKRLAQDFQTGGTLTFKLDFARQIPWVMKLAIGVPMMSPLLLTEAQCNVDGQEAGGLRR